jgi:hypothetical protein
MKLGLRRAVDRRKQGGRCPVPETSEVLHGPSGFARQPTQLLDHERDDVVGVAVRSDSIEIP